MGKIQKIPYTSTPTVGFCGQVDRNKFITLIKICRNFWRNLLFKSTISSKYQGPIFPPTSLRKTILNIIDRSNNVNANFIHRYKYKGGKIKEKNQFPLQKIRS